MIKRYDLWNHQISDADMVESVNGDWVSHDDHLEIIVDLERRLMNESLATKTAVQDSNFHFERAKAADGIVDPVVVPRGLLGQATHAIKNGLAYSPETLKSLRYYSFGRPEDAPTQDREA